MSHDKYQAALNGLSLSACIPPAFPLSVFLEPHNLSLFLYSEPQSLLYLMFFCCFWLGLLPLSKDNSFSLLHTHTGGARERARGVVKDDSHSLLPTATYSFLQRELGASVGSENTI